MHVPVCRRGRRDCVRFRLSSPPANSPCLCDSFASNLGGATIGNRPRLRTKLPKPPKLLNPLNLHSIKHSNTQTLKQSNNQTINLCFSATLLLCVKNSHPTPRALIAKRIATRAFTRVLSLQFWRESSGIRKGKIRAEIPVARQSTVVRGQGSLSSPSRIELQGLCGNIHGQAYSEVQSSCAREFPHAQV